MTELGDKRNGKKMFDGLVKLGINHDRFNIFSMEKLENNDLRKEMITVYKLLPSEVTKDEKTIQEFWKTSVSS